MENTFKSIVEYQQGDKDRKGDYEAMQKEYKVLQTKYEAMKSEYEGITKDHEVAVEADIKDSEAKMQEERREMWKNFKAGKMTLGHSSALVKFEGVPQIVFENRKTDPAIFSLFLKEHLISV